MVICLSNRWSTLQRFYSSALGALMLLALLSLSPYAQSADKPAIEVTISQLEGGKWLAQYQFSKAQKVLVFPRSVGDYRRSTWKALGDDTYLNRYGGFDTIWFDKPSKSAEFEFQPYTQLLAGDYTPFLKFSDGGLALFNGQFELMVANSREQLATLSGDPSSIEGLQPGLTFTLNSNQRMVHLGQELKGQVTSEVLGNGDYIYIGDGQIIDSESYIGVIDKDLPEWIKARIEPDLKAIVVSLEKLLGQSLPSKPSVLFSFGGYGHSGVSNSGGAIQGNMVVLNSSGELLIKESPRLVNFLNGFLAHEISHLFQNIGIAKTVPKPDTWIYEGGAEAIEVYALKEAGLLDAKTHASNRDKAFGTCVSHLKQGTLLNAWNKKERAHYACGELIAYMTDEALASNSYVEFWLALMKNAELSEPSGAYDSQLYLSTLKQMGANPIFLARLALLIDGPELGSDIIFESLYEQFGTQ